MRAELLESTDVHVALEVDDLAHRRPVVDPLPAIELGFGGDVEAQQVLPTQEAQQEPELLLPAAPRPRASPHVLLWQAVTEPIARAAEHRDVVRLQTDLLPELAGQGLLRRLRAPHAPPRAPPPP